MELSKKATAIAPSLTLKIDALSKQMKAEGKDVIGFGAGEPDFPTPTYIKEAAKEALDKDFTRYTPASGMLELKKAVCARYKRKYGLSYAPEQVVISSGAKHSLFNAFQAILNPGDEVIVLSPYWVTYPELVKMADGAPVFVETSAENNFRADAEQIEAAITDKTRAIILNSPSNPCGCVYGRDVLEKIGALAVKHDFYIISDEIYDELNYGEPITSIATIGEEVRKRTIIVNGMSKAYAMTGWRIGYTLSDASIAKVMGSYQSHATSNPCSIAQYASVAALNGDGTDVAEMVEAFKKRSRLMYKLVNDIPGLSCKLPEGAFYIFVSIKGCIGKSINGQVIDGSISFAEQLLKEKNVAVVPGIAFGADEYIRLSYATSEENITKGLARIDSFCRELV